MLEKTLCFRSRFSTTASTTRSVFFTASFRSREVHNRLSVSFTNVSASPGLSCELTFYCITTRIIKSVPYEGTTNIIYADHIADVKTYTGSDT
jgi:hypothetical protein